MRNKTIILNSFLKITVSLLCKKIRTASHLLLTTRVRHLTPARPMGPKNRTHSPRWKNNFNSTLTTLTRLSTSLTIQPPTPPKPRAIPSQTTINLWTTTLTITRLKRRPIHLLILILTTITMQTKTTTISITCLSETTLLQHVRN